ncbi:hypothetical protein CSUNSWCD_1869 [Campylobacter showae CSUNSWCD]|uniref:Uncharacterized protein n=1 Tax=Campylobacter showae CSUNSWCD TaxID=1244083 RepID=M5IRN6_9BACT|nr:hypothetical protein CSUNSWCD_1869 [Campylobacter showae CSUNSWCD]
MFLYLRFGLNYTANFKTTLHFLKFNKLNASKFDRILSRLNLNIFGYHFVNLP